MNPNSEHQAKAFDGRPEAVDGTPERYEGQIIRLARVIQHAQWHDGPGDVVMAVRNLLMAVSGSLDACGYAPELVRYAADPRDTAAPNPPSAAGK